MTTSHQTLISVEDLGETFEGLLALGYRLSHCQMDESLQTWSVTVVEQKRWGDPSMKIGMGRHTTLATAIALAIQRAQATSINPTFGKSAQPVAETTKSASDLGL